MTEITLAFGDDDELDTCIAESIAEIPVESLSLLSYRNSVFRASNSRGETVTLKRLGPRTKAAARELLERWTEYQR